MVLRLATIVAAALLAAATVRTSVAWADEPAPSTAEPRTVSGTITGVDWKEQRLTIATADGEVDLAFDRNTTVFLASRLGTVRQLTVGAFARASFAAGRRAFWIELPGAP